MMLIKAARTATVDNNDMLTIKSDAAMLIAGQSGMTNGTSNSRINENETVSISSEAAVLIPAHKAPVCLFLERHPQQH